MHCSLKKGKGEVYAALSTVGSYYAYAALSTGFRFRIERMHESIKNNNLLQLFNSWALTPMLALCFVNTERDVYIVVWIKVLVGWLKIGNSEPSSSPRYKFYILYWLFRERWLFGLKLLTMRRLWRDWTYLYGYTRLYSTRRADSAASAGAVLRSRERVRARVSVRWRGRGDGKRAGHDLPLRPGYYVIWGQQLSAARARKIDDVVGRAPAPENSLHPFSATDFPNAVQWDSSEAEIMCVIKPTLAISFARI